MSPRRFINSPIWSHCKQFTLLIQVLPVESTTIQNPNENYYFEMEDVSDEEGIPDQVKTSPEYQELLWLKRVRREKEWQLREGRGQQVHYGFKCDGCYMEPIRVC